MLLVSGIRADEPRVFLLDGTHLAQVQMHVRAEPERFARALEEIREDADDVLDTIFSTFCIGK